MILTNKAKYATIAVIDILENGSLESPVSLCAISERHKISLPFLEQIFSSLRKAEIVKSVKGPGGGYILAKGLKDINIADIIVATKEPMKMTRCNGKAGCVKKSAKCKTHHIWHGLEKNIFDYLQSISLLNIKESTPHERENIF
ncbi:MAG: iscR 3 [Rickettsiaceae bacterium]|jgi:Rrf2 family iron-sulfur cluster assembly transcriptional regulator|nr:iscR 3 [Rickettsiaceae bacterium]